MLLFFLFSFICSDVVIESFSSYSNSSHLQEEWKEVTYGHQEKAELLSGFQNPIRMEKNYLSFKYWCEDGWDISTPFDYYKDIVNGIDLSEEFALFSFEMFVNKSIHFTVITPYLYDGNGNYAYLYMVNVPLLIRDGWYVYRAFKYQFKGNGIDWSDIKKIRFNFRVDCDSDSIANGFSNDYINSYAILGDIKLISPTVPLLSEKSNAYFKNMKFSIRSLLASVGIASEIHEYYDYDFIKDKPLVIMSSCLANNISYDELIEYVTVKEGKIIWIEDCFHLYYYKFPENITKLFQFSYGEIFENLKFPRVVFNDSFPISNYLKEAYTIDRFYVQSIKEVWGGTEIVATFEGYDDNNTQHIPAVIKSDYAVLAPYYASVNFNNYQDYIVLLADLVSDSLWEDCYLEYLYRVETFSDYKLNSFGEFIDLISTTSYISNDIINELENDYDLIYGYVQSNDYREVGKRCILLYNKMEMYYVQSIRPERKLGKKSLYTQGTSVDTKEIYTAKLKYYSEVDVGNIFMGASLDYDIYETIAVELDSCIELSKLKEYDFLRCNVWVLPFALDKFDKNQFNRQYSDSGVAFDHMCPNNKTNTEFSMNLITDFLKNHSSNSNFGFHVDHIRLHGHTYCFCDNCKKQFQEFIGTNISDFSTCCHYSTDQWYHKHLEFSSLIMEEFVNTLNAKIKEINPSIYTSAAIIKPPMNLLVGQNVSNWNLDGYYYMSYERDFGRFQGRLESIRKTRIKSKHYPLVGTSHSNFPLVMRQIHETHKNQYSTSFDSIGFFNALPRTDFYIFPKLKIYYDSFDDGNMKDEDDDGLEWYYYVIIVSGSLFFIILITIIIIIVLMRISKSNQNRKNAIIQVTSTEEIELSKCELEHDELVIKS